MTPENLEVWVELPEPKDEDHAKAICQKANDMLKKLGVDYKVFAPNTFNRHTDYIAWEGPQSGFTMLEDNGKWFNLDYLSK